MAEINNDAEGEIITMNDTNKQNWWDDFVDVVNVCEQKEVQNIVKKINELKGKPATMNDIEKLAIRIELLEKKMSSMTKKRLSVLKAHLDSYGKQFSSNRDPREMIISKLKQKLKVYKNRLQNGAGSEFGELISYARNSKDYSLLDLQEKTGISSSYINRLEKGDRRSPGLEKIARIAQALDLNFTTIINAILKRNGLQTDVVPETPTLYEVLISNEFTVDKKVVDLSLKKKLDSMISKIIKSNWLDDKHVVLFIDK